MDIWRLIVSGIQGPAENMAMDEALLLGASRTGIPVLRIYGWAPATLSLGFSQPVSRSVRLSEIRARHLAWIRRPTGGRAVLHDMEVTYSVCAPPGHTLYAMGLEASYECICAPIVAALRTFGLDASLAPRHPSGIPTAACFTAPGATDIVVAGRKIVGSAQMRTRIGMLQHGSILLRSDPYKLFAVLPLGPSDLQAVAESSARFMTGLCEESGRIVTFSELSDVLAASFGDSGGRRLEAGELEPEERRDVERIRTTKYETDGWNSLR
ncbi:MAG: biotin/lipoate A/B protein ligase family protein [Caldisericota bacterium]|nr:biotin/lipoate A/B protein ligase family protein [Caldisericota bacterium]